MAERSTFAVHFRSGLALTVEADAQREDGDAVVLLRDGAVVYRLLARTLAALVPFGSKRAAEDQCRAWREAGARVTLSEQGSTPRPNGVRTGRVLPLEGVSVRVRE